MSKVERQISLSPSELVSEEHLAVGGFSCPVCQGRGLREENILDAAFQQCPRCKGSGLLWAEVTIKWRSNGDALS